MPERRFQAVIQRDEDGFYVADIPALPGCHTQGRTYEEAVQNIKEVARMCIQEKNEDGGDESAPDPEIIL